MKKIKFRIFNKKIKSYIDIHSSAIMIDELNNLNDNLIVEQFTGLHDKNGKEIYVGDIILFQKFSNWDDDSMKRHKATVIFKEGCFMWEILEFGKKSVTYYANATEPLRNTNSICGLEVIGNIYENQELLENKLAD